MGRFWLVVCVLVLGGCELLFKLDDPGPSDGAPADGRLMLEPGCSPMSLLASNFNSGQLGLIFPDLFVADDNNISVSQIDGKLEFNHGAAGTAIANALRFYDIRDSAFSIEVDPTPLTEESSIEVNLISIVPGYGLRFHLTSTALEMDRIDNGNIRNVKRITDYDKQEHRIWKIAVSGDEIEWSTSDGAQVTESATFPATGLNATFMRPVLDVRRGQNDGNTLVVRFDDLNGGVPVGEPCRAAAVHDDFEDGTISEMWTINPDDPPVEGGGVLTASKPADVFANIRVKSSTLYDLRDGESLTIQVGNINLPGADPSVDFRLTQITDTSMRLELRSNILTAYRGEENIGSVPYDPLMHGWWRIRVDGEDIRLETGSDGETFPFLIGTNTLSATNRIEFDFGLFGTQDGQAASVAFDNFNNPP